MTYRFDSRYIGYPNIENVVPVPTTAIPLTISPGFIATAEDPVWGPGEFIFARAGASIKLYAGCTLLPVWDATNKLYTYNATEWPVTATLGRPLYVYQGNVAITVGQYGWFQMSGRSPITGGATIAADTAAGRAAAGLLAASGAGVQILGLRVVTPATQTVVSAGTGIAGDTRINLANTAGFIVGGYLTGTNVGTAAIVSYVDPFGKFVLATVVNSGAVTGNVTVTYNNATIFYNVAEFNRMTAQGIA